jgi:signal transduction histidine kinase/CheY-like chemotaxis protein
MVWALEQARDGTLWVGTAEGLATFDGHAFRTYDGAATEGLSGNKIRALLQDRDGTLWIGTPTGVSVRRAGTFRRVAGPGHIRDFGEDPDGRVWMIGPSGLYRSSGAASSSPGVRRLSLPDTLDGVGRRADVVPVGTDSVWVSAGGHLFLYRNGRFRRPDVQARGDVQALDRGPDGRLWVATSAEVLAIEADETARYAHDGAVVHALEGRGGGGAWVGTGQAGLLRISDGSLRPVRSASSLGGAVHSIDRDRDGQWWVGTHQSGLVRLRPRLFWPVSEAAGIRLSAQGIYAEGGSVWVGSAFQNLCAFADTTRTCFRPADGLPDAQVHSLQRDETGALWVSTNDGLVRRRNHRFETVRTPEGQPVREAVLHRDETGTMWIVSRQGLFRQREGPVERLLPAARMPSLVLSLHRGPGGAVWIGTRNRGVARYDEGRLRWFDGDDGVPYKNVRDIYETEAGTLWIGTYGGGIARYEGDRFTAVTPADGLPAGTINAIREAPPGMFWMTSNDGVFRLPRSQVEAVADGRRDRLYAQTLGTDDGMQARECNGTMHPSVSRDPRGRFWISTVEGAAVIDPHANALTVPDSMPVRVTAIRVDGKPRPLDSLRLAPSTYRVALDFTAVSLRHADDLSFRYRLDGEAWTPARGRRTAEFTNLDAGRHRFEVQATIHGETWYRPAQPLRLTVAPHFYETGWFRGLVGLGILGLMLGAYRWRTIRLRRRQEALETAVEERTRQLRNRTEELAAEKEKTERQAERLAELDEAKNRFFAHISHEFRTPLSLILGPIRDALQRTSDGAARVSATQLRRMASNAERLRRLIDQLLDLATLEAGRMELERRPGDLASVVERAAEAFRSKAEQKRMDLRIERPEARIETRFDPEKVETIVSNLVGNAVKFTPEGGAATVQVAVSEDTDAVEAPEGAASLRGTARIVVADTGPGIAPEVQQTIFDRFEQADTSATRAHEGTGLGLALTSELVGLHGGTIDVDSTPGEGATFTVRLPLLPVASLPEEARTSALPEAGGRGAPGAVGATAGGARGAGETEAEAEGEATILVVEDNAEMRAYLREQLSEQWGVIEAADGEAGWERVRADEPDLVLSDVMMPEADGFELCRRVKADEDLRTLPVLLLTARAGEEATREGLRCGADDYVAKPFDMDELRQRVANHLAARRHLEARYREEVEMGAVVVEEDRPFMERLLGVIDEHLGNPDLTVGRLADEMALSRRQLTRRVKEATGEPPGAVLRAHRMERAKAMLERAPETISEVAYAVGFNSSSSFSQSFREHVGVAPSTYVEEQSD